MKAGWQLLRLGAVCEFDKSQGIHAGLPYVGLEDIESQTARFIGSEDPQVVKSSTFKFSTQHVLYGRLRPYLNKVLAPEFAGHCSTEIFPIKPSPGLSRAYLLYWFLSDETVEKINATCTGARMPRADMNEVLDFDFPIPPLPEQQRIVTLLDEAFDGIATAKANAEKNLQNARAIFESHLQSVFTKDYQDLTAKKLGDESILKIIDGDRGSNYPSKEDFSDDGFCLFLNTKNVRPDGFNFDTTMFISKEKDKALRKGKLQRSDVVLTTRGTIGNVAIYDEDVDFENIRINSGMLIFRPNTHALLPSFLFEVFRSGIMRSQMALHVSGAAQPQLPIKTLVNFEIPIPRSMEAQHGIVLSVREVDAETRRLESIYQQKLTALDELKNSLLHRALNGDL
jgi:type I restriction enzyme S subunit